MSPFGDLPVYEQGSYALIIAGDAGALLRMPVTPPEANMLSRSAEVQLNPDGSIVATMREQSIGQAAARQRGTPFGSYVTSYVVKDSQLLFSRKLVVRAVTIPVADYPNVRSFFERIRAAEQSPVVLVKK